MAEVDAPAECAAAPPVDIPPVALRGPSTSVRCVESAANTPGLRKTVGAGTGKDRGAANDGGELSNGEDNLGAASEAGPRFCKESIPPRPFTLVRITEGFAALLDWPD